MSLIRSNGGLRTRGLFPSTSFVEDFLDSDWPVFRLKDNSDREWMPAANVVEDEKNFLVELAVPGYAKKDIHVEIDNDNLLQITGKKEEDIQEEADNYTRREFSYGSFTRSFQLPETVDDAKIIAKSNDGVLTVELPKKKTALLKKKVKEIKVA